MSKNTLFRRINIIDFKSTLKTWIKAPKFVLETQKKI